MSERGRRRGSSVRNEMAGRLRHVSEAGRQGGGRGNVYQGKEEAGGKAWGTAGGVDCLSAFHLVNGSDLCISESHTT